jgi:hypothetical protein
VNESTETNRERQAAFDAWLAEDHAPPITFERLKEIYRTAEADITIGPPMTMIDGVLCPDFVTMASARFRLTPTQLEKARKWCRAIESRLTTAQRQAIQQSDQKRYDADFEFKDYEAMEQERSEGERMLGEINNQFVYVLDEDEIYEIDTGVRRNKYRFESRLANRHYLVETDKGKTIKMYAGKQWLESPTRSEVRNYTFKPARYWEVIITDEKWKAHLDRALLEAEPVGKTLEELLHLQAEHLSVNLFHGLPEPTPRGREDEKDLASQIEVMRDADIDGAMTPWDELMMHFFDLNPEVFDEPAYIDEVLPYLPRRYVEGPPPPPETENVRAWRWFQQWIAHQIQHPGEKLYTAVLFWSQNQGTGKSLIGEIIGILFGEYFAEVTAKQLSGAFNKWADRKLFVLGNEIWSTDKRADIAAWKNFISDQNITINDKFVSEITYKNCLNYVFTSQHANAMALEADDRRLFVWHCERHLSDEDGKRIKAWAKSYAGHTMLLNYFRNFDLTGFSKSGRAPELQAKKAMIREALSSIDQKAVDYVEMKRAKDADNDDYTPRGEPDGRDLFTLELAAKAMDVGDRDINGFFMLTDRHAKAWANSLRKAGATRRPENQIRINGERRCVWILANANYWLNAGLADIRAAFGTEGPYPPLESAGLEQSAGLEPTPEKKRNRY